MALRSQGWWRTPPVWNCPSVTGSANQVWARATYAPASRKCSSTTLIIDVKSVVNLKKCLWRCLTSRSSTQSAHSGVVHSCHAGCIASRAEHPYISEKRILLKSPQTFATQWVHFEVNALPRHYHSHLNHWAEATTVILNTIHWRKTDPTWIIFRILAFKVEGLKGSRPYSIQTSFPILNSIL